MGINSDPCQTELYYAPSYALFLLLQLLPAFMAEWND